MAYTTIDDPSAYFHVQLYTGDGNDNRVITNDANAGDFKPDLLWLKNRTDVGRPCIWDSSRLSSGEATIKLTTDIADAEANATDRFSGFETDGFTITGSDDDTNVDGDTYVAWQWKANGGTTSSNTDGTVTTTIQANATAGFSIVTWTGNGGTTGTIGHGLGIKPHTIWRKNRGESANWAIAMPYIETAKLMLFDTTSGWATASGMSSYNASTFVDGSGASAVTAIAYCFTEKQGFSKFGQYTGTGGNQFIYTGFTPAFLMEKRGSNTSTWTIYDHKRSTFNERSEVLHPESNVAEETYSSAPDFLSNGFRSRGASNDDGEAIMYWAFAAHPCVTSSGVPATAV